MEKALQTGAKKAFDPRLAEQIEHSYIYEWWRIEEAHKERQIDTVPKAPFIQDIAKLVYWEMFYEQKVNLIDAAVGRGDYQNHGFSEAHSFMQAAFGRQINDPSLEPTLSIDVVEDQVLEYLLTHQFFFSDYNHKLRNVPILEVW